MSQQMNPHERRKRKGEIWITVFLTLVISLLTTALIYVSTQSHTLPLRSGVFFFGLININVILIILLLFLIFRNAIKFILDGKKKATYGLKKQLTISFILFAIIPTVLLFFVSAFYIKQSFDKWFDYRIEGTLEKSLSIIKNFEMYSKNISHAISLEYKHFIKRHTDSDEKQIKIKALQKKYQTSAIHLIDHTRKIFTAASHIPHYHFDSKIALKIGNLNCQKSALVGGEIIRCIHKIKPRIYLAIDFYLPTSINAKLGEISQSLTFLREDNPIQYPFKSAYFLILIMITLVILFCAVWTGLYIARKITIPIDRLVTATHEVSQGNLDYKMSIQGKNELSALTHSFNLMMKELRSQRAEIKNSHHELRQTNNELYERKYYNEVVLENVGSGVISCDANGAITMINAAAKKMLQLTSQKGGFFRKELLPPELLDLTQKLHNDRRVIKEQVSIKSFQDLTNDYFVSGTPLIDRNKYLGTLIVMESVSDVQKMNRFIAWKEIAKRIAHEIKNPLTPIQLAVERLRRRYLNTIVDDGAFDQSTKIILNEVQVIKNLANEFSSFSRLPELTLSEAPLNQLIQDTVTLFESAHESITFSLSLDDQVSKISMDASQMKRAFLNLIDNSIAAMKGSGEISIRTALQGDDEVGIMISDQGKGMSEQVQRHLFEPYFSTKESGSGLGLSIVQQIISEHQGTIELASSNDNGTLFVIRLPRNLMKELAHKLNRNRAYHDPKSPHC